MCLAGMFYNRRYYEFVFSDIHVPNAIITACASNHTRICVWLACETQSNQTIDGEYVY